MAERAGALGVQPGPGRAADPPPGVLLRDGGASWSSQPVRGGLADGFQLAAGAGQASPVLSLAYGTGHGPLYSPSAVVHVRSLFRSDDLGATWQTTRVPGVKTLLDGAVLPDGRALVVTPSGRLVRSQTGTWRQWDDVAGWPGTHGQEEHLSVTADGTLFSARHRYLNGYGGIWVSTDGGSTWAPAAEPTRR